MMPKVRSPVAVLALALLSSVSAAAMDIRVDFNEADTDPAGNWNVLAEEPTGAALIDYATGAPTGATITVTGSLDSSQSGHWDPLNPGPEWLDPNKDAAGDYFWGRGDEVPETTVVLDGFDDAKVYEVEIVSGSDSDGARYATWTLQGAFFDGSADGRWHGYNDGYYWGDWMTWSSVSPAGGQMTLVITYETEDERSRLNAMRIFEVPEPATLTLLGLGVLPAIRRRRTPA